MKKRSILIISACIVLLLAVLIAFFFFIGGRGMLDAVTPGGENSSDSSLQSQQTQVLGSPYKHYYDKLTDIEKRAYDRILSEVYDMPEEILIPDIDADQLDSVFTALLCDNPDLFFVGRNATLRTYLFVTTCSLDYIIDKQDYPIYKAEIDAACDKIIASLTNPDDEWLSELEIHDYIISNCEYRLESEDMLRSCVYGSLVRGRAACEGYSKAAKLLFDKIGIESALVSGISHDENGEIGAHMWNAVKINGDYYYLDLTWDDPVSDDGENVNVYTYFNVTSDVIKENYSDFSLEFDCTSTKENYYIKTDRFFDEYSASDNAEIARLIARELDSGASEIDFRFGSRKELEKAVDDLIDNEKIYSVLAAAREQTEVDFSVKNLNYYVDTELCIITIVPELY